MFLLNSRIPLVRSSSELVAHCTGKAPKNIPYPAILAMHESTIHRRRQVPSAQLKHQNKDPHTQPSEPILFPKLRIYFADFPYLLCSMDQRLLTLET